MSGVRGSIACDEVKVGRPFFAVESRRREFQSETWTDVGHTGEDDGTKTMAGEQEG